MRIIAAILAVLSVLGCRAAQACLDYAPSVVTLRGTLVVRVFPGPPNYEDVRSGDRLEEASLLLLPQPVCANGVPGDSIAPAEHDVLSVHLVPSPSTIPAALRDREVIVTGTLFHSHTGHHRSNLLLNVMSIEAAAGRQQ